jgi:hypothetical protein
MAATHAVKQQLSNAAAPHYLHSVCCCSCNGTPGKAMIKAAYDLAKQREAVDLTVRGGH